MGDSSNSYIMKIKLIIFLLLLLLTICPLLAWCSIIKYYKQILGQKNLIEANYRPSGTKLEKRFFLAQF